MTDFRGAWSAGEVAGFLEDATVPIRIATQRPDGAPWIVALWYRYREGAFECATSAGADLVGFLRNEPAVGFDVSVNEVPYRGVRGHGTATLSADREKALLQDLVERYLGGDDSSLAAWLLRADREEVRIRIEPEDVYSWDYGERMADAVER